LVGAPYTVSGIPDISRAAGTGFARERVGTLVALPPGELDREVDMTRLTRWTALVGSALAAGAVVAAHQGDDVLRADSTLCTRCHVEAEAEAAAHPSVPCQACHPVDLPTGFGLLRAEGQEDLVLGESLPLHGAVDAASCAGCHTDVVLGTTGHRGHLWGDEPAGCVDCHGGVAHGGRPDSAACVGCHEEVAVTAAPMAAVHCADCHAWLSPEPDPEPTCGRCHEAGGVGREVTLHSALPCTLCHQPHAEPFTQVRACETCHDGVEHRHPEVGAAGGCDACHAAHDDWPTAQARCVGCHEEVALADLPTSLAVDAQALKAASEFLAHGQCVDCHDGHAEAEAPARCDGCHETPAPLHGGAECGDCHDVHRPTAPQCGECHDEAARHGGQDCGECHGVHTAPVVAGDCRGCHAEVPAPVDHRRQDCADCHRPHQPEPRACGACHQAEVFVVAERDRAHRDCGECHRPHDRAVLATDCARCHDEPARKGHETCLDCHTPHAATTPTPAACVNCHTAPVEAVANLPGHADCRDCHTEHPADRPPTPCVDCHDEMNSAPQGHADCGDCHAPHDGAPRQATCADCHPKKTRPMLGAPVHLECGECHGPHEAAAAASPRCESCHSPEGAGRAPAGLHEIPEHRECDLCHSAHRPPEALRSVCVECHEEQRDHEPEAPVCQGCHVFLDGRVSP
jgi:hypothetical protein